MLEGLVAPFAAKIAITVVGINWNPAVFIPKNMHISSVALSSFASFFKSFIALIPNGVAAFESPKALAETFNAIFEKAGESGGNFGKISFKKGDTILEKILINPAFCAIFKSPSQKAIIPIKEIEILTAVSHDLKHAWTTSANLPVNRAITNDDSIKKAKI